MGQVWGWSWLSPGATGETGRRISECRHWREYHIRSDPALRPGWVNDFCPRSRLCEGVSVVLKRSPAPLTAHRLRDSHQGRPCLLPGERPASRAGPPGQPGSCCFSGHPGGQGLMPVAAPVPPLCTAPMLFSANAVTAEAEGVTGVGAHLQSRKPVL